MVNDIHASIGYGGGPVDYERLIYQAMLCRTGKPSEDQISQLAQKAQGMLDQMNLGQWKVIASELRTVEMGNTPEYLIRVRAVPVFDGYAALHRQLIPNADSDDHEASYPMSLTTFQFAPGGELMTFRMISTIDVVRVVNTIAATLSVEELMEAAKNHLMHSDIHAAYGLPIDHLQTLEEGLKENLICKIEINKI